MHLPRSYSEKVTPSRPSTARERELEEQLKYSQQREQQLQDEVNTLRQSQGKHTGLFSTHANRQSVEISLRCLFVCFCLYGYGFLGRYDTIRYDIQ